MTTMGNVMGRGHMGKTTLSALAAAMILAGCGDLAVPEDDSGDEEATLPVASFDRTLRRGDVGPDVEWVYRYARQYGYFPNPRLETAYPGWRPALASPPPDLHVFDEVLEEAVRLYQGANGLNVTGEVDDATRALMKQWRCGVPDLYQPMKVDADPLSFVTTGTKWPNGALTFKFTNFSGDLSSTAQRIAVTRAFSRWAAVAGLSFVEVPLAAPANIQIGWAVGDHLDGFPFDGPGTVLAHAFPPPIGVIHFDNAETWVNGVASGTVDLESVAVHEIGHALGLAHTPVSAAVMFASFASGTTTKTGLTQDDVDGMRSLYGPTWSFSWSSAGPIGGKFCTQVSEPSDPDAWHDNFFCSDVPTGMAWSNAGARSSALWSCTTINEPSDPNTWADNFLCLPKSPPPPPGYNVPFIWSFSGPIAGRRCVQWFEFSDPHNWHDNFLCW